MTDYSWAARNFIAVTDAEVWALGGGGLVSAQFVDVSRDQIQVMTTIDTQQSLPSMKGDPLQAL